MSQESEKVLEEGTAGSNPGSSLPKIKVRPPPKLESLHIMTLLSLGIEERGFHLRPSASALCLRYTSLCPRPGVGKAQNRCATYKGSLHIKEESRARGTVRLKPLCGHWNLTQRVTGKVSEAQSLIQANPYPQRLHPRGRDAL